MNKLGFVVLIGSLFWGIMPIAVAQDPGQLIAFDSRQKRHGDTSDIFTIQLNGENRINLTNHPAYDVYPDWSPDGTKIAFSSNRDGNFDIWIMDADGSNLVNVSNTDENEIYPRWSPDGTHILCYQVDGDMQDTDRNRDICLISLDDKSIVRLTNELSYDFHGSWSPDGTQIIFVSAYGVGGPNIDMDLYAMSIDNPKNRTRLTDSDIFRYAPHWISENEIMYVSQAGIHKLNLETSEEELIVDIILPEPIFDVGIDNGTVHLVYDGTDYVDFGLWYFNVETRETYMITNTGPLDDRVSWRSIK